MPRHYRRRSGRGHKRRKYSIQSDLISSQERGYVRFRLGRARRVKRLSRNMGKRVDEHLSKTVSLRQIEAEFKDDAGLAISGQLVIYDLRPDELYNFCQYLLAKQTEGPVADVAVSNGANMARNSQVYFPIKVIKHTITLQNFTNQPMLARFGQWRCLRDVPMIFASTLINPTGISSITNPIIQMLNVGQYDAGGLQNISPIGGNNNLYAYNYNMPSDLPQMHYWFRFMRLKEVRVEPGATVTFVHKYTPKFKLNMNLFMTNLTGEQWSGANNVSVAYGNYYWRGLNDRGPVLEVCGDYTLDKDVTTLLVNRNAPAYGVVTEREIHFSVPPYRVHTNVTNFVANAPSADTPYTVTVTGQNSYQSQVIGQSALPNRGVTRFVTQA